VWFFELAAVADPAAVPDAVAAVLGMTQQPGKTVSESVDAALEGRVRLSVFDNCEHVRDAAADLVEAILAASATVKILATSREGLGVADEQLWVVPSLDVGAGVDSAAVTLFVERARSVASRFPVAEADVAETSSQEVATPTHSHGHAWRSHLRSPVALTRRWPPRTA
jgi:predicted ATPase